MRPRAPTLLALALALTSLLAAVPRSAGAQSALEIEAPAAPESTSALPLIELRGHAGARAAARGYDVVVAIDVSDSTTAYCGHDLDGDGAEGRTSPERLASLRAAGAPDAILKPLADLDLEDSVLFAELLAAQALIDRLDPRVFRVGLVAFSDRAHVLAPLGSRPDALRAAIDSLRRDFWKDLRGTSFQAAIQTSLALLQPPPDPKAGTPAGRKGEKPPLLPPSPQRDQSILLLSDGTPTLPVPASRAQQFSVEAAQEAAAANVRVYTFALGTEAEPALDIYRAMAAASGGHFERIEKPGDAIARLRLVDLAELVALRVDNLTSGQPGRAVRTFPDGSFDAFVQLEPGENRLQVTAKLGDGGEAKLGRVVRYVAGAPTDDAQREQQRALLDELRRRTREVELWAEVEKGRTQQLRELEISPETAAPSTAPSPSQSPPAPR